MKDLETKEQRFKRLAKKRGERLINDIRVLGNLSNVNNYEYTPRDIKTLFAAIEEELRLTKIRFSLREKGEIKFYE